MISTNLFQDVLITPAATHDELCIVSGYASPAFVQTHLYQLKEHHTNTKIKINLIIGMVVSEGISEVNHNSFIRLMNTVNPKFECYYVVKGPPVHAKTYIWLKEGIPQHAYVGSANYSSNGFFTNREIVTDANAALCMNYYNYLLQDSITSYHLDNNKINRREKINTPLIPNTPNYISTDTLEVSLLDSKGEMHTRAGLNWGQRDGRNKNQAYIPINGSSRSSGFFPPKGIAFTTITDDGVSFELVVAQDNNKALETPQSNAILGQYFRQRLNLSSGTFVTKDNLLAYGRTSVIFKKLNDDLYFMDFAQWKK